ncbi:MAG: heme-copper oxidase subunit III [Bacteroidota bacterium]|jgi:cytochrome c oxidase subunit 3
MEEIYKPSPTVKQELADAKKKASKPLLWVGIISIIMVFAGLTSAYVVRSDSGNWLIFDIPSSFYLSTAVLLTSSGSLFFALQMAKKNNQTAIIFGVLITFLLGLIFSYLQYQGWCQLRAAGIVFAGKSANASGSFLYLLTFLHLAHLLAGLISLLVTLKNSVKAKYNSENTHGLELCSIYWHFLDILWVYLFLFLLYIR